jgi:predicted DNA-binding mobile mystery protein A
MDAALRADRLVTLPERPIGGWLRAVRQALGITSAGVATRLGITASGLRKLEQAEASDAITLATLRRGAEALDCELRYVLVPRQSLREMRRQQALTRARS